MNRSIIKSIAIIAALFLASSCNRKEKEIELPFSASDFEKVVDGKKTRLHVLENKNGMLLVLSNYGARIVALYTPDKNGNLEDVVLGSPSLDDYITGNAGVGAIIGPVTNRISNARFEIDGNIYELQMNRKEVTLHSGDSSFYRQVWVSSEIETKDGPAVEMELFSPDGQWGFPGNKNVKVTYTLAHDNSVIIDYEAVTDKSCYFNLTNHAYFNLNGNSKGDILDHVLTVNANNITPFAGPLMVPSGEIMDIRGTDLDFTSPRKIVEGIESDHSQIALAKGYDHNYVLNKDSGNELSFCASVYEPVSGRYMECFTTEPAVQLYTSNSLNGTIRGKHGTTLNKWGGVCLETQHFPDSPTHKHFPNTLLRPGEKLKSRTIYKFSAR